MQMESKRHDIHLIIGRSSPSLSSLPTVFCQSTTETHLFSLPPTTRITYSCPIYRHPADEKPLLHPRCLRSPHKSSIHCSTQSTTCSSSSAQARTTSPATGIQRYSISNLRSIDLLSFSRYHYPMYPCKQSRLVANYNSV
jgi:hypothetical protein